MDVVNVQRTNRRALLTFVLVLIASVAAGDSIVLYQQRELLLEDARKTLSEHLVALGDTAADALLRSDYVSVDRMLTQWFQHHDDVLSIKATTSNGFALTEITRQRAVAPDEFLTVATDVAYQNRPLMKIEVSRDTSSLQRNFIALSYRFTMLMLAFVSVAGWLLWRTLRRTALQPLENEISRRQAIEVSLREQTQELKVANSELEAFCYSVSHDLRTPLRAIDGFAAVLIEDYSDKLDAAGQDALRRVRDASQRLGTVIDDLLSLSQVSRNEVARTSVDLSAIALEIGARLCAAEPNRAVQFIVTPGLVTHGDAGWLKIALENLLGNAWKFNAQRERPNIEFGTIEKDNQRCFFIRDNGVGFDMRHAGKLFTPFQRLHSTTEFSGSGIGLATVARIIQRHGGKVWAEAELHRGATIFFTLPTNSL